MARQRLDKVLAHLGFGSRKEVRALIKSGAVSVGTAVIHDPGAAVDPEKQPLAVAGRPVTYSRHAYLMLHKPAGVVSAVRDSRHATVLDCVPDQWRRPGLFPVGRLDRDAEGLVLLTTDGELAHRLLSPRSHVPRRYYVELDRPLDTRAATAFARGLELADGPAKPAMLAPDPGGCRGHVTVTEGRFHQVKRMFRAVGVTVLYLRRVAMGPLHLDPTLAPGVVRPLTDAEAAALRQLLRSPRCAPAAE